MYKSSCNFQFKKLISVWNTKALIWNPLIYKHIFFSLTDTPGTGKRYAYPDLDFLENDVGLWDTFFSHGKNSSKFQSVLRPPLPIDEYLKQKSNPSGGGSAETPVCSHNLPQKTGSTPASENPKPIIYDSASLRTLLPGTYYYFTCSWHQITKPRVNQFTNLKWCIISYFLLLKKF